MTLTRFAPIAAVLALAGFAAAQRSALQVDIERLRSRDEIAARTDEAVRTFAKTLALQTREARDARRSTQVREPLYFTPVTVRVIPTSPRKTRGGPGPLTLVFDDSGSRAFPSDYRQFLSKLYDQAKPTLDLVFGSPAQGGTVRVRNYDADIADREYLAGGYFLPDNGSGEPEIRFPLYTSGGELHMPSAAVNFIHCLLLAYLGPAPFEFDAFQEGLVRAATMRVARSPGVMPSGLDPELVEAVLDLNYDAGPRYDWTNQPALSGPTFIAPNLRTTPLPIGGSLGGLYLQRYRMAGAAWQKVLVEHPGFAKEFLTRYYGSKGASGDVAALVAMADQAIKALAGPSGTVEGLPFPDWFARQHILDTHQAFGTRLFLEPIPIADGLGGSDFGVFIQEATFFSSDLAGNEQLLSGTSYPIVWDPFFNRVFTSSGQDDRMTFFQSYGSVTPNLPNLSLGKPYAATIDLPVQDRMARVVLPAGAIATASTSGDPNHVYGTVIGAPASTPLKVRIGNGLTTFGELSVTDGAFGGKFATAFQNSQRLIVEVLRAADNALLATRRVNKGPGPLALDIRMDAEATFPFASGLPKGVSLIGVPVAPFRTDASALFGVSAGQLQLARYNPARAAYDLFPSLPPVEQGHGYFLRLDAAKPGFTMTGRTVPNMPVAVALRPGWNLISNPSPFSTAFGNVRVIRGADFPRSWAEATNPSQTGGPLVGADVFKFMPGNNDPFTGAPEGGSMVAATSFEAGVGVFVRVLAPEGVTLLFERASLGTLTAPVRDRWSMKATTRSGRAVTEVVIAQSKFAKGGVEAHDTPTPPALGGTRAYLSLNQNSLYRDTRSLSGWQAYRMVHENLEVGKTYTTTFQVVEGSVGWFWLYDPSTRRTHRIHPSGSFSFVARTPKMTFDYSVRGDF